MFSTVLDIRVSISPIFSSKSVSILATLSAKVSFAFSVSSNLELNSVTNLEAAAGIPSVLPPSFSMFWMMALM